MSWLRNSTDKSITEKIMAPEVAPSSAPAVVALLERPKPLPQGPARPLAAIDTDLIATEQIADYRETAEQIGLDPQDIIAEEFRHFLASRDMPTFNLQAVAKYMDELTAKDNPTGFGWHWCAVRPKDSEVAMAWGRPSRHEPARWMNSNQRTEEIKTPASDFYQSHSFHRENDGWGWGGGMIMGSGSSSGAQQQHIPTPAQIMQAEIERGVQFRAQIAAFWNTPSPAYTRTLPLHALKKIATIEREFKHKVVFLVTEYTTRADIEIRPDPFLMAVIPNTAVSHGKGRFIIDVWDEPGFGIEQMLK